MSGVALAGMLPHAELLVQPSQDDDIPIDPALFFAIWLTIDYPDIEFSVGGHRLWIVGII